MVGTWDYAWYVGWNLGLGWRVGNGWNLGLLPVSWLDIGFPRNWIMKVGLWRVGWISMVGYWILQVPVGKWLDFGYWIFMDIGFCRFLQEMVGFWNGKLHVKLQHRF